MAGPTYVGPAVLLPHGDAKHDSKAKTPVAAAPSGKRLRLIRQASAFSASTI